MAFRARGLQCSRVGDSNLSGAAEVEGLASLFFAK